MDDRISLQSALTAVVVVVFCCLLLIVLTFAVGSWHGEVDQTFREVKLVHNQLANIGTILADARDTLQVMDHRLLVLQQEIDQLAHRQTALEARNGRRR